MAITDGYVTAVEYREARKDKNTNRDDVIEKQIVAASRVFERERGQFFTKDAAVVARVFTPKWTDYLELTYSGNCPGIASTSGVVIKVDEDGDGLFTDETAWASTDYVLWPEQAAQGPEPAPYTRIKVPRWSTQSFIPGNRVEVTAIYGWPEVPEAVKADVIELVSIWREENPRSTGRVSELDEVLSSSPMAMSLVKRWANAYKAGVTF